MPSKFSISSLIATAQAQAAAVFMDQATLGVYEGPQPENADEPLAAVNRLLALFRFPQVEAGSIYDGVINFSRIEDTLWMATGKPSFARLMKDSVVIFDCSVGVKDADILIDASPVAAGAVAHIVTGATYRVPK
jgi:hypothetical protein